MNENTKLAGAIIGTALVVGGGTLVMTSDTNAQVTKVDESRFTVVKEVVVEYNIDLLRENLDVIQRALTETQTNCSNEITIHENKIGELEALILTAKGAGIQ